MEITEVRVKLVAGSEDRLQAFCSVTFDDCFVVRDLKIIEGSHGPFVAMPSRKLMFHCQQCRFKNHLKSSYCNKCGGKLVSDDVEQDEEGRSKLYADIAHPINSECRELIQSCVIEEYEREKEQCNQTDYLAVEDEDERGDALQGEVESVQEFMDDLSEANQLANAGPGYTVFQAAEAEPRPPHVVPTEHAPEQASSVEADSSTDDDFGAGIL